MHVLLFIQHKNLWDSTKYTYFLRYESLKDYEFESKVASTSYFKYSLQLIERYTRPFLKIKIF